MVKSTYCSSEDPEFKSQQPHGGWFTTTHNEIWCPRLVCPTTATVYLHIINKSEAEGGGGGGGGRQPVSPKRLPFEYQRAVLEPCRDR